MSSFDKIIGYDSIKLEIMRICDVVTNGDKYKKLGVILPNGLLLHGEPGVGKTLMANIFIEESGRTAFICRKNLPRNEFIKYIKNIFEEAKHNTPSIILLDDFDKFANGDENHKNAEEYVTIQSCIDEIKDFDVFVIATANDLDNIPFSLSRAGRFDTVIKVDNPTGLDAEQIIKYYLQNKSNLSNAELNQIARLLNGCSCADLEIIVNQAGIYAGFQNKTQIEFDDILKACLRKIYDCPQDLHNSVCINRINLAYHEAGHVVISELLEPNSVTIVSIDNSDKDTKGFTSYYKNDNTWYTIDKIKQRIMCLLGGRCASELVYGQPDSGSCLDLESAVSLIKHLISNHAIYGLDKRVPDLYDDWISQEYKAFRDKAILNELQRYYQEVKTLLANNRRFLDAIAEALNQKKILLSLDIQEIRRQIYSAI